jgi:hypothetical protein
MKKSQNNRYQEFSCYFCLTIEGSIPRNNGSGSEPATLFPKHIDKYHFNKSPFYGTDANF